MSYGFQLFGPAATLDLDPVETYNRLVASVDLAGDYSGSFAVPDFDDTKGSFSVSFVSKRLRRTAPGWDAAADTDPYVPGNGIGNTTILLNPYRLPSLSWNNTTKMMTVVAANPPAAFLSAVPVGYSIDFVHFR